MKSTGTFKQFFYENLTAGSALGGSVGGFTPDTPFSSDFYAPGKLQIPKGGAVFTRKGKYKNKRRKKIKK
jgi:hypothetical protein